MTTDNNMTTTTNNQFNVLFIATVARMKLLDVDHEALAGDTARKYFEVLYQFAPSLAATPIVAASWLKNAMQTKYLGAGDVAALCRVENEVRRTRENERRRLLDSWHILMRDPELDSSKMIAKSDPQEHALRVAARTAVLAWLEIRPELVEGA